MNTAWCAIRRIHASLGTAGLWLGVLSLLSFGFGLIVLTRESDRLRRTGRDALRPVITGWVRTLPVDYLGATLTDYAVAWQTAFPRDKPARLESLRATLARLGEQFDRPEARRAQLVEIVALDLGTPSGPALARWRPRNERRPSPLDLSDPITILEADPPARPLPLELVVRYRLPPEIERAAAGLEALYRRLTLALVGLSLFPLLCLAYMVLQARALTERAAREAAQAATLDLADRTCHELGNAAFVLSNEGRNLKEFLDLVERFLIEEPQALDAAARQAGLEASAAARFCEALRREHARRGLEPGIELEAGYALARDVSRQLTVCSAFIALTVRELDGYLKQSTLPVRLESIDVNACLQDAVTLLGPRLEGVELDIPPADPPVYAQGDRRLLVHALVNLIKNAVEAALSGGRPPRIMISIQDEIGMIAIAIQDNGPGIRPESRAQIFKPGYSTKGPGRGRGLAIVAESIRLQNGGISLESRDGEGATFQIKLPGRPNSR